MLILGAPGSGKTITLLTLAEALLEECTADPMLPTPVVFNLSSWAENQPPLDEWLVEELNQRYHMPEKVAQGWVANDDLLLLLDGLDEVAADQRDDCVAAINAFRQEHIVNMVVCSRIEEYEALTERLDLHGAIAIRPLTEQQIDRYIASAEPHLFTLKQALANSADLRDLAQTPLMLSVMTLTYHDRHTETETAQPTNRSEREQLFDAYIRRMFQHRDLPHLYTPAKTLHWLQWLGDQMVKRSQTVFYIEWLQPSWLTGHFQRNLYRLLNGLIFVLIGGLMSGIVLGVPIIGWLFMLFCGLIFLLLVVLIGRLIFGLVGKLNDDDSIKAYEEINFSWRNGLHSGLLGGLSSGLSSGLMFGLIFGLVGELSQGLTIALAAMLISGLINGLIFGLVGGLYKLKSWSDIRKDWKKSLGRVLLGLLISVSGFLLINGLLFVLIGERRSSEASLKTTPNQGIWQSLKNALTAALVSALVSALASALVFAGIVIFTDVQPDQTNLASLAVIWILFGLLLGLVVAFFCGLLPCIQHVTLRIFLYSANHIPWNYARFLDYAAARLFLRKVGGGYIFVHRMVLEHIAALTDADIERITRET